MPCFYEIDYDIFFMKSFSEHIKLLQSWCSTFYDSIVLMHKSSQDWVFLWLSHCMLTFHYYNDSQSYIVTYHINMIVHMFWSFIIMIWWECSWWYFSTKKYSQINTLICDCYMSVFNCSSCFKIIHSWSHHE